MYKEDIISYEEQKELAIKALKQLRVDKAYINKFKNHGVVTLFEGGIGFFATAGNNHGDLEEKIKEIEKEYGCVVYAVTHEFTEFGELYDMLIISKYKQDFRYTIEELERRQPFDPIVHRVYAYVWNKDDDFCSEFGSICVKTSFEGPIRIS